MSSRLLILALVGIALAIGLVWYARTDRISALPSTPLDKELAEHGAADPPVVRSRLRQVTREQRDRLAEQITRAAAQRARDSDRPRVEPVKPTIPAHESADPAVRKFNDRALEELGAVQGYLSKCFEVHRKELPDKLTVLTRVLIDTDPDVGAVLTADQLTDPDGKPLPAAFDDCIRNMLQTFALPPLPPTQDSQFLLALQLSFRDDD